MANVVALSVAVLDVAREDGETVDRGRRLRREDSAVGIREAPCAATAVLDASSVSTPSFASASRHCASAIGWLTTVRIWSSVASGRPSRCIRTASTGSLTNVQSRLCDQLARAGLRPPHCSRAGAFRARRRPTATARDHIGKCRAAGTGSCPGRKRRHASCEKAPCCALIGDASCDPRAERPHQRHESREAGRDHVGAVDRDGLAARQAP